MQKLLTLFIIFSLLLCNQEIVEKLKKMCKNYLTNSYPQQYVYAQQSTSLGIYKVKNFKTVSAEYRRLYQLYVNGDQKLTEMFFRTVNLLKERDYNKDYNFVFEDLTYEYENCYITTRQYAFSSNEYIETAYFLVEIPKLSHKIKLSYELLRSLSFVHQVFIFNQIVKIHKYFRQRDLFGLFFNLSDFVLDLENSKLLFDPGHLQFPKYIPEEKEEETFKKESFSQPPFFDLNGYPKLIEKMKNNQDLSMYDLQQQDAFCLIMLCIKVFGQDPELIFEDKNYDISDFMSSKKNQALYNAKQYIIFKSTQNKITDFTTVENYFFYIFSVFKKDDYSQNYQHHIKLLQTRAFIIDRFEKLGCKYQRARLESEYKQVDLNYQNMKFFRRISDFANQVFIVGSQYVVFKIDDQNSKFNTFETLIELINKKKIIEEKLHYREIFLQQNHTQTYRNLNKVLHISNKCIVNQKFLGYEIPHFIESTLEDYMSYNLLTIKQKLDVVYQITEIASTLKHLYPLNFQIQDFLLNEQNPEDSSMEFTIYLNPLKEAEIAYTFGKKKLKQQFCQYKVIEGIMNTKIYSQPSPESYLICNQQEHYDDISNKIDSWNLCQIYFIVFTGRNILSTEDNDQMFFQSFEDEIKYFIEDEYNIQYFVKLMQKCFQKKIQQRSNIDQLFQYVTKFKTHYMSHLEKKQNSKDNN